MFNASCGKGPSIAVCALALACGNMGSSAYAPYGAGDGTGANGSASGGAANGSASGGAANGVAGSTSGGAAAGGSRSGAGGSTVCAGTDFTNIVATGGYSGRNVNAHSEVADSYAAALQRSILFWEAQESGHLSAGNRLSWRGPAHTDDGQDIGLDVSGGWYDAGDHWKANGTMAHGAGLLAWSLVSYEHAYTRTKQLEHALNTLGYITEYFEKCIDDKAPSDATSFSNYRVVIDVGGLLENAPQPDVHSVWCAPEVTNGYTVREAVVVDKDVPGSDIAGAMAGAMAASAIVFHKYCDDGRAQRLYAKAAKLLGFGLTYRSRNSTAARRPNGQLTSGGMRGEDRGALVWGAVWLHRAAQALGVENAPDHLGQARAVINEDFRAFADWWRDFAIVYNHGAMLAWLEAGAGADEDRLVAAVREHLRRWDDADTQAALETDRFTVSPKGLKVRSVYEGTFSSARVLNEAALAAVFADWSKDPADARYFTFAQKQLDYFLGANEIRKSFLIGFGDFWQDVHHHRGAHGPWAGWENRTSSSEFYLSRMRHVLYGAMLPGPRGDGTFDPASAGDAEYKYTEPTLEGNAGFQMTIAALAAHAASSPALSASFPPAEQRNESLDPRTTDREFFVEARRGTTSSQGVSIHARLNNRSSWPARVSDQLSFRYFFGADGGASAQSYSGNVQSSQGGHFVRIAEHRPGILFAEVSFAGTKILPNKTRTELFRRDATLSISTGAGWDESNDWSADGLTSQNGIRPRIAVYDNGVLVGGEEP
jgi:hypothetical protein